MAFVLNNTTLRDAIIQTLNRKDSTFFAEIPRLVANAERRVSHDMKVLPQKAFVTDNLIVGMSTLAKPTRWLNNWSFNIGINEPGQTNYQTRVQVLNKSLIYCRMYWPNPVDTGQPLFFADYTMDWLLLSPTPDQAYPYELGYYQYPTLLDEVNSENTLTVNVPELLQYACFLEAAICLGDPRAPMFEEEYMKRKASITSEDQARIYDGYNLRSF